MTTEDDPRSSAQTAPTRSGEGDRARARSSASPRPGRELRVSSLAQRRLESGSLFPGPPPQPGRGTAVVSDLVAVVSGFASATVMTYLFTRRWVQAVVIGAILAAFTLIQRVAARRRRPRPS